MAELTLAQLKIGQSATVNRVTGNPTLIQRLAEQGLFSGERVELVGTAPLGDPLEILIGGTHLSVRVADASEVYVQLADSSLPS